MSKDFGISRHARGILAAALCGGMLMPSGAQWLHGQEATITADRPQIFTISEDKHSEDEIGVVVSQDAKQFSEISQPAASSSAPTNMGVSFLGYPKFKIPFNVDAGRNDLAEVQLWVSTDQGATWQMHGMAKPEEKQFEFRAAAEGIYFFSVQTVDQSGNSFPSQSPPLKVYVDTTKPETAIRADLNGQGQLVVDIRIADENLSQGTAALRVRTDRNADWQAVDVSNLVPVDGIYEGQVILNLPQCREVGLAFEVLDQANNRGQASFRYVMPRTAQGEQDMTLASTPTSRSNSVTAVAPPGDASQPTPKAMLQSRPESDNLTADSPVNRVAANPPTVSQSGAGNTSIPDTGHESIVPSIANAQAWVPQGEAKPVTPNQPLVTELTKPGARGPGLLARNSNPSSLTLNPGNPANAENATNPNGNAEQATGDSPSLSLGASAASRSSDQDSAESRNSTSPQETSGSAIGEAFHCNSRAFSLDYSVEALGGSRLSEVELWGSEDGGRTWQKWGSDPDRQSPFDVQVGNDGLFGFRMVIVNENGLVSNRPKDGETADAWINVDTNQPEVKITRAVYGEGPEDGMLVIDYQCADGHMTNRPINLSYSESIDGPWIPIANGLKNTGIYLWRAEPDVPAKVFLKMEAVDKAGNIGVHRLDVPIDTKGLAPRGKIQGFRPIINK